MKTELQRANTLSDTQSHQDRLFEGILLTEMETALSVSDHKLSKVLSIAATTKQAYRSPK